MAERRVSGTPELRLMLLGVLLPALVFGLVLAGLALALDGVPGLVTVAFGWATVVVFYGIGQTIEAAALRMPTMNGMMLLLVSYAVRVTGIAAGLWAILRLPSVAPYVRGNWLLLSVAGTVIVWVVAVVVVASRRHVPVYDTPYVPPETD